MEVYIDSVIIVIIHLFSSLCIDIQSETCLNDFTWRTIDISLTNVTMVRMEGKETIITCAFSPPGLNLCKERTM